MTSARPGDVEPRLLVVGLGPAGLDRVPSPVIDLLLDPGRTVVLRTIEHPAAEELAARREVVTCDDLYESGTDFDAVYAAIADRVIEQAKTAPTVYAVPGSPLVGERTVGMLRARAADAGISMEVVPGESFVDLVLDRVGVDPLDRGVQIIDGRDLPDPLPLHVPTIIAQVDHPAVLAEVSTRLASVLAPDLEVVVLDALGAPDERVETMPLSRLAAAISGPRTSLYLDPPPVGWVGLVQTNRRLRQECPWDRKQTHHTLLSHLIEEAYETVEAITLLPAEAPGGEVDYGAYAVLEEELGDLLLQVVFHATLAREAGAFDVEEVAEGIRRKLVRRHPHVFGDVVVDGAEEVIANWEALKAKEKRRGSLMDDVPAALPAIARADKLQRRAASVGFDWDHVGPVLAKVREELAELEADLDRPDRVESELGDLLFAVVNLARHLGQDPEIALRRAADRFADRFRAIEASAVARGRELRGMSLEELDALWDEAKASESTE